MFGLSVIKHKRTLKQSFSDCLLPVQDQLGNVPVAMQSSKVITASVLGICRVYSDQHDIEEPDFELIVDAVFEEIFRRESVAVQTLTESWLQDNDAEFMHYYYDAKARALKSRDLLWFQHLALQHFTPSRTIVFPL